MVRISSLLGMALALGLTMTGAAAQAQTKVAAGGSPFAPSILVNDLGITGYEIDQRMKFMTLLHQTGDLQDAAEKSLIEDRLRIWQARQDGVSLSKDAVAQGMAEFAGRANMKTEDFIKELAKEGVDAQTYRDFVTAGMLWREVVRAHFAPRVVVTDADIDRALAIEAERGKGTRVLISEIIIPMVPGHEAEVKAEAEYAATLRGEPAFAAEARKVSASATRDAGGRLDWLPLENLPPALRPSLLALAPGQATAPIQLPNAIAVFMLRGIDEGGAVNAVPQTLGYAALTLGPAGSPEAAALASKAEAKAKDCDDLYTVAKGLPESWLERAEPQSQSALPKDIALALAPLDVGEMGKIQRAGNDVLVMLCTREKVLDEAQGEVAPSRDEIRAQLLNERLSALSDSYMADLVANAVIVRK